MGLPYEDELDKMIAEEDEEIRKGECLPDTIAEVDSISIWWRGAKYVITGANFIRSIEPFNQELCDIIFDLCDKHPSFCGGFIGAIEMFGNKHIRPDSIRILPKWLAREIDNDPTIYERFESGKLTSAERKRIEEAQGKEREAEESEEE